MTRDEIKSRLALAAAATPGEASVNYMGDAVVLRWGPFRLVLERGAGLTDVDLEFIADAHDGYPEALRALERVLALADEFDLAGMAGEVGEMARLSRGIEVGEVADEIRRAVEGE